MPDDPEFTSRTGASPRVPSRPRRRWLGAAGLIAALVILIPLGALVAAATLLPTELIARSAAQRAEALLGQPVAIGELEIDFWPVPSVSLLDSRVGPEAEPVARIERILLRPRLLPLLSRRVIVREIAIDRPDIRLSVDSTGQLNLPLSGEEDADEEGANVEVDFAIDEFRIRDGRLGYRDQRDGTDIRVSGLQQALRIDGRLEGGNLTRVGLTGRVSSDSVDASVPGRLAAPLEGVRFALDHEAELDRAGDRLEIGSLRLEVQRLALEGSGRIEAVSDSLRRSAALQLRAEEFGFEDLARSLPEGFLAELLAGREADSAAASRPGGPEMAYGGRGSISARVTGPLTRDSIPRVEGTLRLREASLTRGGASILSAAGADVAFSNDAVASEAVTGNLFGAPFAMTFQVTDFAAPVVLFTARGVAGVEDVMSLVESDEPLVAAGTVPFDLRGRIVPAEPAASLLEGTVGVGGIRVELPSLRQPIQISSGTVRFAGEELRLEDLAVSFGESRVRAAATVQEWLPSALGDSSALAMVRFEAAAGTLDLDALLGPSESQYTPLLFARLADRPVNGRSAAEAASELGFSLPELPRVRAEGTLRAERLVRNGLVYEELDVTVESSPTALSAPRLRFGLMGGTVELGLALERREREANLVAVYRLENVGAGAFFTRFTPFQGRLSGLLMMDGEASLQLDEQMLPVRPTVRSSGRAALTSGSLANWPLLGEVGERLGLQSFDTLAFREWSGEFLIAGPLVSIERSTQLSEQVRTELAGSFDFAGRLDLGLVARLSPELVAGAGEQVRSAAAALAGERESVPVGLRISGTPAAPTIAVDLSAARDEALARARERATQEAESAARRAASEVVRGTFGDSVPLAPEQVGEAVRTRVQDRLRGIFGRPPAAPRPPDSVPADTVTAAEDPGGGSGPSDRGR